MPSGPRLGGTLRGKTWNNFGTIRFTDPGGLALEGVSLDAMLINRTTAGGTGEIVFESALGGDLIFAATTGPESASSTKARLPTA